MKRLKYYRMWWTHTIYDVKYGIKNIFSFIKSIWLYRAWDPNSSLRILKKSLELHRDGQMNRDGLLRSYELSEYLEPKIKDTNRCIQIIDNILSDKYSELYPTIYRGFEFVEVPETDNGEKLYAMEDNLTTEETEHNSEQIEKRRVIEKLEWNELFETLKMGKESDNGMNTWI